MRALNTSSSSSNGSSIISKTHVTCVVTMIAFRQRRENLIAVDWCETDWFVVVNNDKSLLQLTYDPISPIIRLQILLYSHHSAESWNSKFYYAVSSSTTSSHIVHTTLFAGVSWCCP